MAYGKNKLIAVVLAIMVAMTWSFPAFAEDDLDLEAEADKNKTEAVSEEPAPPEEDTEEESKPAEQSDDPASEPEAETAQDSQTEEGSTEGVSSDMNVLNAPLAGTDGTEESSDEKAEIQDGTYEPDKAEFTGGSGRVAFDCQKVIVVKGKAFAVFTVNTDNVTHAYMGDMGTTEVKPEIPSLYDPATGETGKDVYAFGNRQVSVPIKLNEKTPFSGRTIAMSENSRWINSYTYKITLTPESKKISDSTEIPENPGETPRPEDPDDPIQPTDPTDPIQPSEPSEPTEQVDPGEKQTITAGTWKAKATTKREMFYLYPKTTDPAWVILKVNKDKTMTATITLSGTGYDYVYMGTPKQARSAGKSKWIKAKIVNGYYTFTIPVKALDKKLAITPHSSKYELDNDPTTDPWRPNKWILIYSKGAVKVKDGTSIKTGTRKNSVADKTQAAKDDKKADKESKWKDDRNKSTRAVDNSTSLKDGVYKPDSFRWSGGSGRLAYIRCNKITVRGGKAYATIEFSSSKYDSLKANGRVYSKQGGGNSVFVIPVKLNANNTIIGRTTAMSQPHWVKYKIYIGKAGATEKDGKNKEEGKLVSTKKLSDKAPELVGLESKGAVKVDHAKLFRIFKYEQDITLICVDQYSDTALYVKPKKDDEAKNAEAANQEEKIEYDEDGKPIPKSENEITNELYQNNVVNYLVVPEGVELPAGIEKDCIIIQKPVDSVFASSEAADQMIKQLGQKEALNDIEELGDYDRPDFRKVVLDESDLVILPSEALPARVTKKSTDEEIKDSEEKTKILKKLQTRYSSLSVPIMADRSDNEATNYGAAEWVKVYGAIFGEEKAADEAFDQYVKTNKKETTKHEEQ